MVLPATALFATGSASLIAGCCDRFLCSLCAVLLYLVTLSVVALLGGAWVLGHSKKWPEQGSEEITLFEADVLPLDFGQILMSYAPGRRTRSTHRSLSADVSQLKHRYGVDIIVSLLSPTELESMSYQNMGAYVEAEGIMWMHLELRDKWIPWNSQTYLSQLVIPLTQYLRSGSRVLVHCNGGKGRTGTLVAALLMTSVGGRQTLQGAIASMRRVRPGMLKNPLQQLFLSLHLCDSLRKL